MKQLKEVLLKELESRLLTSWKSSLQGLALGVVMVLLALNKVTVTQVLEVLGSYHAIRLAFKKEFKNETPAQ